MTDPHTIAELDQRSAELQTEFIQHFQELQAASPTPLDQDIIFQGWAIQKIAWLQVSMQKVIQALARVNDV